jgi:membrane protein YdbS with pleckstrin-like domain
MKPQEIHFRKSPFVFLKRAALLIFAFALVPSILTLLLDVREQYTATPVGRLLPDFSLFVLILMAVLQFVMVALAFITWYLPVTIVNRQAIVYRPGMLGTDRKLANTSSIADIEVKQGLLGRRLDYGTLVIATSDSFVAAAIKDVAAPAQVAETIRQMIDPSLAQRAAPAVQPIEDLVILGENQHVEFKASLLWDYNRQSVNKDLYEPVMKNVVAFLNTAGGVLLIGVADDGQVLGLEQDFAGLPKKSVDGWENAFNMAFSQMIGAEFRQYVGLGFERIDDKTVCAVSVQPASAPAYLAFKGKEDLYIRTGNSSQPLALSKVARYVQTRFPGA